MENKIDIRRRTILLSGEINYETADTVITGLHLIRGPKPIHLLINSEGGDDDNCRAIIAAIHKASGPVHGHVLGVAESAAAWILQACAYRTMDSHSSLMLHLGDSTKNKHNKYIDRLFIEDVWARMLQKDPSYPRSRLVAHLEGDWNVYPSQAVELGLADEVVGK